MLKIVIMDDEYYFRQAVKKYLKEWCGRCEIVGEAKNGQEGLELIRELRPDIALVDINMPVMNGIEMAEELYHKNVSCKLIILTGYSDFQYAQKAIHLDIQDYLLKPVDRQQLIKCLEKTAQQIDRERNRSRQYKEWESKQYKNSIVMKEHFINKILYAHTEADWMDIEQMAPDYLTISGKRSYQAFLMDIYYGETDYWEEKDISLCKFELDNILTELFAGKEIECVINAGQNKTMAILTGGNMEPEKMEIVMQEVLDEFCEIVERRFYLSLLVCVGDIKTEFRQCEESFLEAYSVERFMFLYRKKGLYFYGWSDYGGSQSTGEKLFGQDKVRLLSLLGMNNTNAVMALLQDIFDKMKEKELAQEIVLQKVNELVTCVLEFAKDSNIYLDSKERVFLSEFRQESLEDIQSKISWFILKIMKTAHENELEKPMILPERIICYIEDHFNESNLSLDKLSKVFGVSKPILCRQFKDAVRMTIGEYIFQTRMWKAKNMLDKGYNNIALIAQKCAYEDAGYFSKCFKKYYGVAPSALIKEKQ